MEVGDVWYLKADSSKYIITGFAKDVYPDDIAVLFNTGDMVDSFTLLNSNLFTKSTPHWKQVYQETLTEQESYEDQHAEEPYWDTNDLVPNPGDKPKRKLFR